MLWSLNSGEASRACEQYKGGHYKSENRRTKKDGASRKFATWGPKNMVIVLYFFSPTHFFSMRLKSSQC
jgi:hypothetical protein